MYNCYMSCVGAMVSKPALQALEAKVSGSNPTWGNFYLIPSVVTTIVIPPYSHPTFQQDPLTSQQHPNAT